MRPQDLAVERVGEADELAAAVGADGQDAGAVERLELIAPHVASRVARPAGSHTASTSSASLVDASSVPSRAATNSCRRGVVTSGPNNRHTPCWWTR